MAQGVRGTTVATASYMQATATAAANTAKAEAGTPDMRAVRVNSAVTCASAQVRGTQTKLLGIRGPQGFES